MRITILTENTVRRRGLLAEHGLSVLVEDRGRRLLFDTGQSGVYLHNASRMHKDLDGLDGIVISHGHYDHAGGLEEFPGEKRPVIFLRPEALEEKRHLGADGTSLRDIGIPWRHRREKLQLHFTRDMEEIFPDIFVVGNIPTVFEGESSFGLLFTDKEGERFPDGMPDEQLLVIRTSRGLAVFAGCAHPGILSCLQQVKKCFPGEPIRGLLAGMHLQNAGPERIRAVIRGLKEYDFEWLIPLHCTGTEAIVRIRDAFGSVCLPGEAGYKGEWES